MKDEVRLKLFIVDLDVKEEDACHGCFFFRNDGACQVSHREDLECQQEVNGIGRDYQWIEVNEKGKPV
jgi:hypothetical protein